MRFGLRTGVQLLAPAQACKAPNRPQTRFNNTQLRVPEGIASIVVTRRSGPGR